MALPNTNHHSSVRGLTLFRISLLIPVLLFMSWTAATAQLSGKGQINGTVTDTSGAAIPGSATSWSTAIGRPFAGAL